MAVKQLHLYIEIKERLKMSDGEMAKLGFIIEFVYSVDINKINSN